MKLSVGILAIAQAYPSQAIFNPWWHEAAKVFSVSNLSSDSFKNVADSVSRNTLLFLGDMF